jgi:hypothetical protein
MGKLRDQMLADLQLNGAVPSTQKNYLRMVGSLAKYFNRSHEGKASIGGNIAVLCCGL